MDKKYKIIFIDDIALIDIFQSAGLMAEFDATFWALPAPGGAEIQKMRPDLKALPEDYVADIRKILPDLICLKILKQSFVDPFSIILTLKKLNETKSIPVFTLYMDQSDVKKAAELGAADCISASDIVPAELRQAIISYLENPGNYKKHY